MEQKFEIDRLENYQCTSDNNCCSGDNCECISSGRDKAVNKKNNSAKEMRIKCQKYKDEWEKYPQSQDRRRMRLTEFMWSQCKPTYRCN